MASRDPYQTSQPGADQPPPAAPFGATNWDLKSRLFFVVPGLLYLSSGILFPILHQIGIPTPGKGLFFIATASIFSVFSTRYVLRHQIATRPTILLTFLSHLVLHVVCVGSLTFVILLASNIL